MFGETLRYRDRLQERLGLTDLRAAGPHPADIAHDDREGTRWSRNPDLCCRIRKVLPVRRALKGFRAQITGRKRFQTAKRASLLKAEIIDGRICFNPLADWSPQDLETYRERYRLPKHPLTDDGYVSIGCLPCTKRVAAVGEYRSGRWEGFDKEECGIHTGIDGDGI
jgi:phosphoadenosine phosphosulfate reductase